MTEPSIKILPLLAPFPNSLPNTFAELEGYIKKRLDDFKGRQLTPLLEADINAVLASICIAFRERTSFDILYTCRVAGFYAVLQIDFPGEQLVDLAALGNRGPGWYEIWERHSSLRAVLPEDNYPMRRELEDRGFEMVCQKWAPNWIAARLDKTSHRAVK